MSPIRTITAAEHQNLSPALQAKYPTGSVISSGSGSGGVVTSTSQAESKTGSYVAGKGFVTSSGQVYPSSNPTFVPEGYTSTTPVPSIYVQGGVVRTSDGSTIIGNATVPGTGLTSNQIVRQAQQQAINAGYTSREAQMMAIPYQTQQQQIKELSRQMPGANTGQLLAMARAQGLVETPENIPTPTYSQAYQRYVQGKMLPEQQPIFDSGGNVFGYEEDEREVEEAD